MKGKLAIIGASYLQLPLIEKAKRMGYETHVFAWAAGDVGEVAADYFYPISIREREQILEKCRTIGVNGVVSIASDLAMVTVNYVAEKLKLPGNSLDCTLKTTNKAVMRESLLRGNCPIPRFYVVDNNFEINNFCFDFPVIVKPTDRSGSRGIFKAESYDELKKALEVAKEISFEGRALLEEFMAGKEYSVESISFHGWHHLLAITEKETTGAPRYIETGHKEPADLSAECIHKIKKIVFHALDVLGVTDSASHSEIMICDDENIKIVEIGARMGGDCIGSHLVYYSTGIDYVRATIQVAVGEEPDLTSLNNGCPVKVVYILNQYDLEKYNYEMHNRKDNVLELVFLDEDKIGETESSADRAGCYIKKL